MVLRMVWLEANAAEAVEDSKSQSRPDVEEEEPRGDERKGKNKINKL